MQAVREDLAFRGFRGFRILGFRVKGLRGFRG